MSIDPVCGMEVDEGAAPAKTEHEGETYYFCSEECRTEFLQDPEEFLNRAA